MSDAEDVKRGREMFEKVMGFEPPEDTGGDLFLDATIEHLFANVWSRPGLSIRERRLVTLTVLTCLGNKDALTLHLGAALRGDLTAAELEELMLHLTHYGGWPVGAFGSGVLREVAGKALSRGDDGD